MHKNQYCPVVQTGQLHIPGLRRLYIRPDTGLLPYLMKKERRWKCKFSLTNKIGWTLVMLLGKLIRIDGFP